MEIKVSQNDLEVLELLNKSHNDESYIINKFKTLNSIIKIQDSFIYLNLVVEKTSKK